MVDNNLNSIKTTESVYSFRRRLQLPKLNSRSHFLDTDTVYKNLNQKSSISRNSVDWNLPK